MPLPDYHYLTSLSLSSPCTHRTHRLAGEDARKQHLCDPSNRRRERQTPGQVLKPIVGTGAIDLTTKIPWCEDTYIALLQIFMEQDTEQQQIMEAVDKEQSNLRASGSPRIPEMTEL